MHCGKQSYIKLILREDLMKIVSPDDVLMYECGECRYKIVLGSMHYGGGQTCHTVNAEALLNYV